MSTPIPADTDTADGVRRVIVELYRGETGPIEGEELGLSGVTLDSATWSWLQEKGYDDNDTAYWINIVEPGTFAPNNNPIAETTMAIIETTVTVDGQPWTMWVVGPKSSDSRIDACPGERRGKSRITVMPQYKQILSSVHTGGCTWGNDRSSACTCAPDFTDAGREVLFDTYRALNRQRYAYMEELERERHAAEVERSRKETAWTREPNRIVVVGGDHGWYRWEQRGQQWRGTGELVAPAGPIEAWDPHPVAMVDDAFCLYSIRDPRAEPERQAVIEAVTGIRPTLRRPADWNSPHSDWNYAEAATAQWVDECRESGLFPKVVSIDVERPEREAAVVDIKGVRFVIEIRDDDEIRAVEVSELERYHVINIDGTQFVTGYTDVAPDFRGLSLCYDGEEIDQPADLEAAGHRIGERTGWKVRLVEDERMTAANGQTCWLPDAVD